MKKTFNDMDLKNLSEHIYSAVMTALTENEKFLNYNDFKLVSYKRNNGDDLMFVKENRKKIYQFFVDGYKNAGLDTFSGCYDANSILKNFNELKIAYSNNIPIAMSIYTGYKDGYKCVGITATIDNDLHRLGVKAVHEIIKNDIKSYKQFYWIECSYAIEKLYDKYGGIAIPSIYVPYFLGENVKIHQLEDGYHYEREISDTTCKKIIYGFNNKETYDQICKIYNRNFIDSTHGTEINESFSDVNKAEASWQNILVFYDGWCEGVREHTEEGLEILSKNVEKLEDCIIKCEDEIPENKLEMYRLAIENGKDILNTSTLMKCNIFE